MYGEGGNRRTPNCRIYCGIAIPLPPKKIRTTGTHLGLNVSVPWDGKVVIVAVRSPKGIRLPLGGSSLERTRL